MNILFASTRKDKLPDTREFLTFAPFGKDDLKRSRRLFAAALAIIGAVLIFTVPVLALFFIPFIIIIVTRMVSDVSHNAKHEDQLITTLMEYGYFLNTKEAKQLLKDKEVQVPDPKHLNDFEDAPLVLLSLNGSVFDDKYSIYHEPNVGSAL